MASRVVPEYGRLGQGVSFGDAVEEGGEAAVNDGVNVAVGLGSVALLGFRR